MSDNTENTGRNRAGRGTCVNLILNVKGAFNAHRFVCQMIQFVFY